MAIENVTLNPSDFNGTRTLSNGNLTDTVTPGGSAFNIRATHGKTKGKWYWETKIDSGTIHLTVGVSNRLFPITSTFMSGTTADSINIRGFYGTTVPFKLPEGSTYGQPDIVGVVIGVALDLDNGTLEFYRNGVSMGVSHTNLLVMGEVFPHFKSMGAMTYTVNFGSTPFAFPVPSGYQAYNIYPLNKILISSSDENLVSVERYLLSAIPKMTSYNTPSGIVSASSHIDPNGPYLAWKAFNKVNGGSLWFASTTIGWLSYKFPVKKSIIKYVVTAPSSNDSPLTRMPKNWTFEGSDDGVIWRVLDTQNNQMNWGSLENRIYKVTNTSFYLYYRINITINNGDANYMCIGELDMFEMSPPTLKSLTSQTEQNFINHGMDKSVELDLSEEMLKRTYTEQSPTSIGGGKVFKKLIETSRVPIKKVSIE